MLSFYKGLVHNICMLNKFCNGNPITTFPPYYGFHTLTKLFNRPGVGGAVLKTPQKDSLLIQLCVHSGGQCKEYIQSVHRGAVSRVYTECTHSGPIKEYI